jgi:hypothetical protein
MTPACSCQAGRWSKAAGAALSGALAILLPKCPLCIAAWVAAVTGVTLPAIVAGSLRPFLVIACLFSALLLVRPALARFRIGRV